MISRPGRMVAAATATMAVSLSLLFVLATVGPLLVDELGMERSVLGAVVAVAYGIAVLMWRPAASVAERLHPRAAMTLTAVLSALALALVAVASGTFELVLAGLIAGAAQALANPATNLAIVQSLPEGRSRATAVGTKQAGVPLGALLAGAALPSAAGQWGWRAAVGAAALVALVVVVVVLSSVPRALGGSVPQVSVIPGTTMPSVRDPALALLCGFQLLLGAGVAAVNTYLPLFATEALATTPEVAGTLTLAVGATGITARVVLTRRSAGPGRADSALGQLTAIASLGALALAAAPGSGTWLAWVGALLVGGTAVAANAVAMLVVIQAYPPPATARASGIVSAGFFAGFAIGPPLFGLLVDATPRYALGWTVVACVLGVATLVGNQHRRVIGEVASSRKRPGA